MHSRMNADTTNSLAIRNSDAQLQRNRLNVATIGKIRTLSECGEIATSADYRLTGVAYRAYNEVNVTDTGMRVIWL